MGTLIVAARDLNPGDLLPFSTGGVDTLESSGPFNLTQLERIVTVGIDPVKDLVDVHSFIGGKVFIAVGLPGDTVLKVYREEME